MTEPHSGEPHQLLGADRHSHQDCRQLKFRYQQTIKKPERQDPKNAQTQLK